MPDSPISGLAALAVAADGDLLAIVDDPLGFPVTKKITVAALADSTLAIGQIYTNDAAGSQTLTLASTWYKVTQWDNNGFGANTTPDQANDKITLDVTGLFLVSYQVSFSGSANSRYRFQVRWNGAQQLQTQATRVIGSTGDAGSCSGRGVIDVTVAATDVELWVYSPTGASRLLNVINAQLIAEKVGST